MKHHRLSAIFVAATAATILMASTSSFAGHRDDMNYKGENFKAEVAPCPPPMILKDGFYVGLGASYDAYKMNRKTTIDDGLGDVFVGSDNHGFAGWDGTLFIGYGMYFDTFYLGAELGATMTSAKESVTGTEYDAGILDSSWDYSMKARTSYNIGLLPGIKVNDSTLLYARVGYMKTQFKASASITDGDTGLVASSSNSRWQSGINFGVGMETYLAENFSGRGEFTHTSYSSHTLHHNFEGVDFGSTKFSPSNNEYTLSLIYHVDAA